MGQLQRLAQLRLQGPFNNAIELARRQAGLNKEKIFLVPFTLSPAPHNLQTIQSSKVPHYPYLELYPARSSPVRTAPSKRCGRVNKRLSDCRKLFRLRVVVLSSRFQRVVRLASQPSLICVSDNSKPPAWAAQSDKQLNSCDCRLGLTSNSSPLQSLHA